ncbi:hypothetical protein M0802_013680, partial [Mischocyttarus mexicanus]
KEEEEKEEEEEEEEAAVFTWYESAAVRIITLSSENANLLGFFR